MIKFNYDPVLGLVSWEFNKPPTYKRITRTTVPPVKEKRNGFKRRY